MNRSTHGPALSLQSRPPGDSGLNPRLCLPVIKLVQGDAGYVTITASINWPRPDTADHGHAESTGRVLLASCLEELKRLGLGENAVIRTRIRMTDPTFWPILAAIRHELLARSRATNLIEVDTDGREDGRMSAEFDAVTRAA